MEGLRVPLDAEYLKGQVSPPWFCVPRKGGHPESWLLGTQGTGEEEVKVCVL